MRTFDHIFGLLIVVTLNLAISEEGQFPPLDPELVLWLKERKVRSRDDLRNSTDNTQRLLADAMDREDDEGIYKYAMEVIDAGGSQVIVSYLRDSSLTVKKALSMALAERKQKDAIPDLTNLYHVMTMTVRRGGASTQFAKSRMIEAIENALIQLTGISPDPGLKASEKVAAFRKYSSESEKESPQELRGTVRAPIDLESSGPKSPLAPKVKIVPKAHQTKSYLPWLIIGAVALGIVLFLLKISKGKSA